MSNVTPIKDKPGQRLFDWQMLVDTAGNTSEYLVVDNGPYGSLREFIEQLEIVPAKFLLLSDLPGGMSKGDFATILTDALTGVTLTVDGESAAAGPVVSRVLPLTLTLDAIREIQVLPPSGVGAAALVDITTPGNGKKLNITFPEVPEAVANQLRLKTRAVLTSTAIPNGAFTRLENWTITGDAAVWDTTGFRPENGGNYFINVNIQMKGSNAGLTDNYDAIFSVVKDGDVASLPAKTAFFMDRRENYDHTTVVTFGFRIPIVNGQVSDLYEFYAYIDPGVATVTGTIWIEELNA